MALSARPRRSVLYMPGSKTRAIEKARNLPADALILDLEDAVGLAEKEMARDQVVAALAEGGFGGRELIVRINALDSEWGEADLKAAAQAGPDAILIPKVESADMVREVAIRMTAHGAPADTGIWAMMETPMGMLKAAEIAGASSRLACFVMGTNDLMKDLGAQDTEDRQPLMTALGLCMLAARAHGLVILDGVYNAFKDEDRLRRACEQGKIMGFDGKTLIHPAQLAIANDIFAPSPEELALAERYVTAFDEAVRAGRGVAVVDGRLVENLHVERAQKMIAMALAIEKLHGEAA